MFLGDALLDGPSPESREPRVIVQQRLGRKAIHAAEKATDVGRRDAAERWVSPEELLELAKGIVIVAQGGRRKPPGMRGDEIALQGSGKRDAVFIHEVSGSRAPVPIMTKQYR
jgi:hypothetical protein